MYWYCSAAPVILFCRPERQDLREADVEEQPFHQAGEDDQALQQRLVALGRAGGEVRVGQRVDKRDQELVLVANRSDLVVGVEYLALLKPEGLDDVLIRMRVNRFFERLPQQKLAALRRGDVAIRAEHDVIGGERIRGDEESQIALDQPALVIGQPVRVLPQRDVARHVHFLRHPVIGAGRQVLFPGPFVFERDELIDVGAAVDDPLVGHVDPAQLGRVGCHERSGRRHVAFAQTQRDRRGHRRDVLLPGQRAH